MAFKNENTYDREENELGLANTSTPALPSLCGIPIKYLS